jgi:hypothetical protein
LVPEGPGKAVTSVAAISAKIPIEIAKRRVLVALGYIGKRRPPSAISSLVDEYVKGASQLIDARYLCSFEDITAVEDLTSVIRDSVAFESRVVADLLERCSKVVVCLTTIGERLERKVRRLARDGSMVDAYVLDAVGSTAVEQVADYMEEMAGEMARADGLVASRRFSPGHCDWNITQQKSLFSLARADSIGISLTELGLMVPRKSISGIIGLGPPGAGVETYNPCPDCGKYDCLGRRLE